MSAPFFQDVNPPVAPDPVTPQAAPGDPAGWAKVTPVQDGEPAPYSISAPQDIAGITGAVQAAMNLSGGGEGVGPGAGIPDRYGPRQQEAQAFLDSPQGAGAMNVTSGFPDYENTDVSPGPDTENPIQGTGTPGVLPEAPAPYPGTVQPGVPQFMAGLGGDTPGTLPGVPPEGGSIAGSADQDYPGTVQDGLTKYGTS